MNSCINGGGIGPRLSLSLSLFIVVYRLVRFWSVPNRHSLQYSTLSRLYATCLCAYVSLIFCGTHFHVESTGSGILPDESLHESEIIQNFGIPVDQLVAELAKIH